MSKLHQAWLNWSTEVKKVWWNRL